MIFGARGQIGRALAAELGPGAIALGRDRLDITDSEAVAAILREHRPGCVFNAAAYTAVDRAEAEPERAFAVNGNAPGTIARHCATLDIPLVHFSTDYVYSGEPPGDRSAPRPWRETDEAAPASVYGASKLAGDRAVAAANGRWLIFRTGWIYDHGPDNFVARILHLARERTTLSVVDDQIGTPNYAPDLAAAVSAVLAAAENSFPTGLYHLSATGPVSWHGFAEAIIADARGLGANLKARRVEKTTTKAFGAAAPRPAWSVLDTQRFRADFCYDLGHWRHGLARCLAHRFGAALAKGKGRTNIQGS